MKCTNAKLEVLPRKNKSKRINPISWHCLDSSQNRSKTHDWTFYMKVHLFQLLLNYWAAAASFNCLEWVSEQYWGNKLSHQNFLFIHFQFWRFVSSKRAYLSQNIRVEWNIMFLNLKHSISNMCFPKRQILPIFRAQHFWSTKSNTSDLMKTIPNTNLNI